MREGTRTVRGDVSLFDMNSFLMIMILIVFLVINDLNLKWTRNGGSKLIWLLAADIESMQRLRGVARSVWRVREGSRRAKGAEGSPLLWGIHPRISNRKYLPILKITWGVPM